MTAPWLVGPLAVAMLAPSFACGDAPAQPRTPPAPVPAAAPLDADAGASPVASGDPSPVTGGVPVDQAFAHLAGGDFDPAYVTRGLERVLGRRVILGGKLPAAAPSSASPAGGAVMGPSGEGDAMQDPLCKGVKVFSISKADDPDASFALFTRSGASASKGAKAVLRQLGGQIGDRHVGFIGWDRVWLEKEGAPRCQAKLVAAEGLETADLGLTRSPPRTGAVVSSVDPAVASGIHPKDATHIEIERATIDRVLGDTAGLLKSARVVPELENGKPVGLRIFGVREGSLLALLGLENGDRIERVNGFDISTPDHAAAMFDKLRGADQVTLQVQRRGASQTLDYVIK